MVRFGAHGPGRASRFHALAATVFALLGATALEGCGNGSGTGAGIGASGHAVPGASGSRPIALMRPSAASEAARVTDLSGRELSRAIRHYAVNKGTEPGPFEAKGIDLDGDGRPEALVYFTGEAWCARSGCTLAILAPGQYGYRAVSTIRRVKRPIIVEPAMSNGWRNLVVRTGAGGYEQTARLRFSGRGYPGNAMLAPTVPQGIPISGTTIFASPTAAAAASASTGAASGAQPPARRGSF